MKAVLSKLLLCLCAFPVFCRCGGSDVYDLKCDSFVAPVGVSASDVDFSWKLDRSGQTAYRLMVVRMEDGEEIPVWDSGKILSAGHVMVPYEGDELDGNVKYFWRVRIWDGKGVAGKWSAYSSFVTARRDLTGAEWIGYEPFDEADRVVPGIHVQENHDNIRIEKDAVVPCFRKEFVIEREVEEAYLSVSGLGHYEAGVNGTVVSAFMAPGWTDYDKTVLFNTYDVSDILVQGENVISAIVGNGFHYISDTRYHKLSTAWSYPRMIAVLTLRYSDGGEEEIVSDSTWKTSPSPVTFSSIYGGEDYDATAEQTGWDRAGFDDSAWKDAVIADAPAGRYVPESDYPSGVRRKLEVRDIFRLDDNTYTYDFGQNASGIIEVRLVGKRGDRVRFWPGELVDVDKRANQRASGTPYYYEYTLKGDGEEVWRPRFTFYGFRYVTVENACPAGSASDDMPEIMDMAFYHTGNTSPQAGGFECSSGLLNNIYSLIDWAIRSNMHSVLTDCPHREKLGWLEQSYLMGNSIRYNYSVYHLYRKIVHDMIDSQREDGLVPDIAPEYVVFSGGFEDSPEWGSACVMVPWNLYRWYGDEAVLKEAWPMMERYVAYLSDKADGGILSHGLGDWFDNGPGPLGESQLTPVPLTATAIYFRDVMLLSEIAEKLGYQDAAEKYREQASEIEDAFNKRFFDSASGKYAGGSQTSMAMPLCLGLVPEKYEDVVREGLLEGIRNDGYALTAGDIGFHFLVEALSHSRESSEILYRMINRDDVPGYGFQLRKGATALTESWAALEEVSNNHLMLGHVMEWFYTSLLGIRDTPDSIASSEICIRPVPVGDIAWAKGSYDSPQGEISVSWRIEGEVMKLKCEIPMGTAATVMAPEGYAFRTDEVGGGSYEFTYMR